MTPAALALTAVALWAVLAVREPESVLDVTVGAFGRLLLWWLAAYLYLRGLSPDMPRSLAAVGASSVGAAAGLVYGYSHRWNGPKCWCDWCRRDRSKAHR